MIAETEENMKRITKNLIYVAKKFGLVINEKKKVE